MSLLISIPTMVVGLRHHRARGAFEDMQDVGRIVLPMALGTVFGGMVGGWLVAYASPGGVKLLLGGVKLLLGCVLIASALHVFKVRDDAVAY